jgi:hypothetical protein
MTDEQIQQNAIKAAADFKDWHHPQMSFYNGYIAGAHSIQEHIEKEMSLIVGWFEHIAQLATDKKTLNGFVMSDSDTFDEIVALAKRSQEYIKLHLYDK